MFQRIDEYKLQSRIRARIWTVIINIEIFINRGRSYTEKYSIIKKNDIIQFISFK